MQLHEHTADEQQAAMDELSRHMRAVKERRDSLPDDALQAALTTITEALTHHWSTGGGTRLRRFIWSLWNDWHLVNLYHLCSGLDYVLGDAVLVVFRAQMVGALTEDHKRAVLQTSGEFARWEHARAETPEDEDVLYPPPALDTEDLSRLARSAEHLARRMAAERRAEQARFDAAELEQAER
ncbi:MAG TPA: hypothetical protein VF593_00800 [Chthoniobacteraceae bacterium]|jgi:hypothetical protein